MLRGSYSKVFFYLSNLFIYEWGFDAAYPANGKIWTFPVALSKIYGITAIHVYNAKSAADNGIVRVRTYNTVQATFANGSATTALPLFYSVIGQN